jgi:hypothetical protein
MNDGPSIAMKLRWWWLVLFAPALTAMAAAPAASRSGCSLFWVVFASIWIALPLNFICSNWPAIKLVLLRDSRGGANPWMFLWGPLTFGMNCLVAFGGCTARKPFTFFRP